VNICEKWKEIKMTDYSCFPLFHLLQAVDWWSVGIIAFELLTGFTPFEEGDNVPRLLLYE
jgi:serine/threonine protein kinase